MHSDPAMGKRGFFRMRRLKICWEMERLQREDGERHLKQLGWGHGRAYIPHDLKILKGEKKIWVMNLEEGHK